MTPRNKNSSKPLNVRGIRNPLNVTGIYTDTNTHRYDKTFNYTITVITEKKPANQTCTHQTNNSNDITIDVKGSRLYYYMTGLIPHSSTHIA